MSAAGPARSKGLGMAIAGAGAIVLSAGAMWAAQKDTKAKDGPSSIYKEDAGNSGTDARMSSAEVSHAVSSVNPK